MHRLCKVVSCANPSATTTNHLLHCKGRRAVLSVEESDEETDADVQGSGTVAVIQGSVSKRRKSLQPSMDRFVIRGAQKDEMEKNLLLFFITSETPFSRLDNPHLRDPSAQLPRILMRSGAQLVCLGGKLYQLATA